MKLYIDKYAEEARSFSPTAEPGAALHSIEIEQEAWPRVDDGILQSLGNYLKHANAENVEMLKSLAELRANEGNVPSSGIISSKRR